MSAPRRAVGAWILTLALVVGAGVLTAIRPGDHATEVPFTVNTPIGVEGVARNIAITVHEVQFASRVTGVPTGRGGTGGSGSAAWSATGNWLVVDLDASAVIDQQMSTLALATLDVDGMTFSASERMTSLLQTQLVPGVPQSGLVAFELPESLSASGPAVLTFGTRPNSRLDAVVQVRIDLAQVGSAASVAIDGPSWSVR